MMIQKIYTIKVWNIKRTKNMMRQLKYFKKEYHWMNKMRNFGNKKLLLNFCNNKFQKQI